MPALVRVELWTDVQCATDARCLAHVPGRLGLTEKVGAIDGERTVELTLPGDCRAAPLFAVDRVLRLQMRSADDPGYLCVERRISKIKRRHAADGFTLTATARAILQDLGTRALVVRRAAGGRAESRFAVAGLGLALHVQSFILPALTELGYTWWTLGTVESEQAISTFVYDNDTPLSALRRLADAAGVEFDVRALFDEDAWVGTGYALDFVQRIGAARPTIVARPGKQLTALEVEESAEDQATVIAGVGGTASTGAIASLAGARWLVTLVDPLSGAVTLADPVGGAGPVGFDGQLSGTADDMALALAWPGVTPRPIQLSLAATQTVYLDDVSGLGPGQLVRFVRASDGGDVVTLSHPLYRAQYGSRVAVLSKPEIPDTINLVPNGAVRTWHPTPAGWALDGVFPDGWTAGANLLSISKETDPLYWKAGGASARCVLLPGGYLETEPIPYLATDFDAYVSLRAELYVVSGVLCLEALLDPVYTKAPAATYTWPQDSGESQVLTDAAAAWFTLAMEGMNLRENNLGYVRLRLRALTAAEVCLDGMQLTGTPESRDFVEGAAPTRLWQAVNERLSGYAPPAVNLTAGYLDLETAGGGVLQYDVLQPGQRLQLTDPVLGLSVATRLLGWSRDWAKALNVALTLSNRPIELTRLLARGAAPSRPPEPPALPSRYVPPPVQPIAALLQLVEIAGTGPSGLVAVVTPNASVNRYRFYRKKGGWPTTNGLPGGDLDPLFFVAARSVLKDGGGVLADGSVCAGGRGDPWAYAQSRDTTPSRDPNVSGGWLAGEVGYAIVVPLDGTGNPGARALASCTIAAATTPHVTYAAPLGNPTLPAGLGCSWATSAGFDANTAQLVVEESVDGAPWVAVYGPLGLGGALQNLVSRGAGYYPGSDTDRLITWRWRIRVLDAAGVLLGAIATDPLPLRAIKGAA